MTSARKMTAMEEMVFATVYALKYDRDLDGCIACGRAEAAVEALRLNIAKNACACCGKPVSPPLEFTSWGEVYCSQPCLKGYVPEEK